MKHTWNRVKTTLPNLNVLVVNEIEQGFIYKPKDSKTDQNAWRVHLGIGETSRFIGHAWSMVDAKRLLESLIIGNIRGLNY
jgi:hypothetical protein